MALDNNELTNASCIRSYAALHAGLHTPVCTQPAYTRMQPAYTRMQPAYIAYAACSLHASVV